MEKEEFIKRARKMGYTDKMIQDDIAIVDAAAKDGIRMDYEILLIGLPNND